MTLRCSGRATRRPTCHGDLGPNPNLRDIALGEVTVYKWKDKAGRGWKGGLFKPVPYDAGRRIRW